MVILFQFFFKETLKEHFDSLKNSNYCLKTMKNKNLGAKLLFVTIPSKTLNDEEERC